MVVLIIILGLFLSILHWGLHVEKLNNTLSLRFFSRLSILALEDGFCLWLGKQSFLRIRLAGFGHLAQLLQVELEDLLCLSWGCVEFDLEVGVIFSLRDTHIVEELVDIEEQVNIVS